MSGKTLQAEMVPIHQLKEFKGNPRTGNVDVIRESLRLHGQYRPIVVRTETNEILAGNHTWKAAVAEGWSEIWATWCSCDDATAKKINLIDNRAPELGGYDGQALLDMLTTLPDLDGTGWSGPDLEQLQMQLQPQEEVPDGPGGEAPPNAEVGVLVICQDPRHQANVLAALQTAQTGDTTFLTPVLSDARLEAVTV